MLLCHHYGYLRWRPGLDTTVKTTQGNLFDDNGWAPVKTRADQIEAAFKIFFHANPIVWKLICERAFWAMGQGMEHYSISECIEWVRWWHRENIRDESGLKIRNDFRAYYARLFHVAYPEHDGFFRTRKRPSTEKGEFKGDPPPNIDPPEEPPDDGLNQRLRDLLNE
jgi:hypothetical protein